MSFRLSGQKINIDKEVKYFGLKLDQYLIFKQHMHTIKLTINTANGFLVRKRYHIDSKLLKTICCAIFESHLRYCFQLWRKTQTQVMNKIEINSKQSTPNNRI